MNTYRGIVLKQYIQKMVSEIFPPISCKTGGKDCTCLGHKRIPGKKGRPISNDFAHFANSYNRDLPNVFVEKISEDPNLIRGVMDALCEARRNLTPEEQEYINNSRDAKEMDMLDGEPVQVDVHHRFVVRRQPGESLGMACLGQYRRIIDFAQSESNYLRTPLYIYLERYAIERNLRDVKSANEYGAPESAVGLMSKNVAAFIVTDVAKSYKGAVAVVAYVEPEIKVRVTKTEEQFIQELETVS